MGELIHDLHNDFTDGMRRHHIGSPEAGSRFGSVEERDELIALLEDAQEAATRPVSLDKTQQTTTGQVTAGPNSDVMDPTVRPDTDKSEQPPTAE